MIPLFGELFGGSKNSKADSTSAQPSARKYFYVKIEDIVKIYSDKINDTALNEELIGATIFVGGEFSIDYVDERSYTCSYNLFFQDKNGETYSVKAGSKPLDIQRLKTEAAKELTEQKNIKFEIPELTEAVRKSYKIIRK